MKKYIIIGIASFVGYMVESKNWNERIKMALASSIGYTLGSLLIYLLKV